MSICTHSFQSDTSENWCFGKFDCFLTKSLYQMYLILSIKELIGFCIWDIHMYTHLYKCICLNMYLFMNRWIGESCQRHFPAWVLLVGFLGLNAKNNTILLSQRTLYSKHLNDFLHLYKSEISCFKMQNYKGGSWNELTNLWGKAHIFHHQILFQFPYRKIKMP